MGITTDFIKILEIKRYSKQTIASYSSNLSLVQSYFEGKSFRSITDRELFSFIYHLVEIKKVSASAQHNLIYQNHKYFL